MPLIFVVISDFLHLVGSFVVIAVIAAVAATDDILFSWYLNAAYLIAQGMKTIRYGE